MNEQTRTMWWAIAAVVLFLLILYSVNSQSAIVPNSPIAAPAVSEKPLDMPVAKPEAKAEPESEVIPELEQAPPPQTGPRGRQQSDRRHILKWPGRKGQGPSSPNYSQPNGCPVP